MTSRLPETGNSFTTGISTLLVVVPGTTTRPNSGENPTASQVFLTMASLNKLSPNDCEYPTTGNGITAIKIGNRLLMSLEP